MNFNPYEADRVTCAKSRDIRQPTCGKGVAPGAPGCLPRLRSTSPLRFAFASARRSARVLVASALCFGESDDGGLEEFFELLPTRWVSSSIRRVSISTSAVNEAFSARRAALSLASKAFSARRASISAWKRSWADSGTPPVKQLRGHFANPLVRAPVQTTFPGQAGA